VKLLIQAVLAQPPAELHQRPRVGQSEVEGPDRADRELDRRLDQRAAIDGRPERGAGQQRVHQRLQLVIRGTEDLGQPGDFRAIGNVRDEFQP
jgi:hypothetical protein